MAEVDVGEASAQEVLLPDGALVIEAGAPDARFPDLFVERLLARGVGRVEPGDELVRRGQRGRKKRRLDTLALAREVPMAERRDYRECREVTRAHVVKGGPDADWRVATRAGGDGGNARDALDDDVVARISAPWARGYRRVRVRGRRCGD